MNRWWLMLALAVAFAARAGNAVPDVGWTQRIGAPLPLQLTFDENAAPRSPNPETVEVE